VCGGARGPTLDSGHHTSNSSTDSPRTPHRFSREAHELVIDGSSGHTHDAGVTVTRSLCAATQLFSHARATKIRGDEVVGEERGARSSTYRPRLGGRAPTVPGFCAITVHARVARRGKRKIPAERARAAVAGGLAREPLTPAGMAHTPARMGTARAGRTDCAVGDRDQVVGHGRQVRARAGLRSGPRGC
jgi:hypothetical protein